MHAVFDLGLADLLESHIESEEPMGRFPGFPPDPNPDGESRWNAARPAQLQGPGQSIVLALKRQEIKLEKFERYRLEVFGSYCK